MGKTYQATINRGTPMPSQCEICSSIHKDKNAGLFTEQNSCFLERNKYTGIPEEAQKKMDSYAPFVNSKRTILLSCKQFAHVKSVRETASTYKVEGKLQTPYDHLLV